jgi:predicted phage gp36 major capsid-like protein
MSDTAERESGMPENIAQTVQKAIQDIVAPDVRELKIQVAALQKQMDQRFDALTKEMDQRFEAQSKQFEQRFDAQSKEIDQRFEAQSRQSDAQFEALMAALREFKAQSELSSVRVIAALSERVAVLEARRQ